MAGRSRRLTTPSNLNVPNEARILVNGTCTKCGATKALTNFHDATDLFLNAATKKMPVCKSCQDTIYGDLFSRDKSYDQVFLKMCRMFNVLYSEEAVNATENHLNKNISSGRAINSPWVIYLSKLRSLNAKDSVFNFTFSEPVVYRAEPISKEDFGEDIAKDLGEYWGEGFTEEEYQFLERKLVEWKSSYSCNTKSEEFYLKEACHKELDLRKVRSEKDGGGRSVDAILKSMDTLMKSAALTPAQANAASSGRTGDTLGVLLKRIISEDPAEYYKDKELFKDYDNLDPYFMNYAYRPAYNFFTGNKNYELVDEDEKYLSDDSPIKEE
jgi:hypothetical protein